MVRSDIPAGYQATQAVHAGIAFAVDHPKLALEWNYCSNSLVVLSARDELELSYFIAKFEDEEIAASCFYEPDYDNQLMAVAAILTKQQAKQLRSKPLLLKGI